MKIILFDITKLLSDKTSRNQKQNVIKKCIINVHNFNSYFIIVIINNYILYKYVSPFLQNQSCEFFMSHTTFLKVTNLLFEYLGHIKTMVRDKYLNTSSYSFKSRRYKKT